MTSSTEQRVLVHLLVAYRGCRLCPADVERSRDEAQRRAETFLTRVRDGEDLASLAREHSDEPFGRRYGGRVEVPVDATFGVFREAAQLPEGVLARVEESEYGFHLLMRIG